MNTSARPNPGREDAVGDRIGHYKLLQLLGEGGMGSVWMALQEQPVHRRVALKIVKLGMDTREVIGRFEAERQALALMDHPNIAKVFDAGATDNGRPFFVMELVQGTPITRYCDDEKVPTAQRLQLFMDVCHAIQHAHQKGIIHRDIKPSNVLVTFTDGRPVPKVIDFGIAKATAGMSLTAKTLVTAVDKFVGTPSYMSPEQAGMDHLDIDTRSDIYALGTLLYELLTGRAPLGTEALLSKGLDEIRRILREVEPPCPSARLLTLDVAERTNVAKQHRSEHTSLVRLLRGDLDWIVMKTLEKDRCRRYETANDLALDLERFLHSQPILACPVSQWYRLKKLVRRSRLAFTAATAVLTSLLLGLGASTVMFFHEREARAQAETARQNEVGLRLKAQAAEKTARTLAELHRLNKEARLLSEFATQLRDRAAATSALDQAEQSAQTAIGLADQLGQDRPERGATMATLAVIQLRRGNLDKAEALARAGLRLIPPGDSPEAITANIALFASLVAQGRTNDASQVLNQDLPGLAGQALRNWQRDATDPRWRTTRLLCANNLKMISLAFMMWADDHEQAFPFNVPRSKGGTLELCSPGADGFEQNPAPHFMALSGCLGMTKTLVCPADRSRIPADNFLSLAPSNVTYQIRSGPARPPGSTNEVLVRCPIHGLVLNCCGVVSD